MEPYEIVQSFAAKFGLPDNANDDARRAWTLKVAQQLNYSLGSNWGTKSSSPSSPQSADVVCTKNPFQGWDTLNGNDGSLQWNGPMDLTGQAFLNVTPWNWLEGSIPVPVPGDDVVVLIKNLQKNIQDLTAALGSLSGTVSTQSGYLGSLLADFEQVETAVKNLNQRPVPSYSGKVLGFPITLTPIK